MGSVYKAEDLSLDRFVAIKVIRSARPDAEDERLFVREAQALSRIQHPSVVTILEVLQEEGITYLVMQFIEGSSLRARLGGGSLNVREVLDIGCDVAAGLKAAHDIGVVHRDIKPENVIVRPDGHATVVDFGVARLVNRSTLREKGRIFGSLPYMAPEQIRGGDTDARVDVHGLGVLLFELLAGRRPFLQAEEMGLIYEILETDPP